MAGSYIEVSIVATSETEEALCDFLFTEGALGLITEEVFGESPGTRIRASFAAGQPVGPLRERLARYRLALAALGLPIAHGTIQVRELPIEDWGRNWKQHFTPLPVGRRLLIAPPWEAGPFPPDRLVIRIEPAMAFGTGHHATTRMCLESLEAFMAGWIGKDGPIVLDAGTGTGILAIAAAALGAPRVVALDTDPEACEAAGKNLVLNRASDRIQARHGGLEILDPGWRFDLVLANLDTKTLCPLFGALRDRLAPGGRVIISGVPVEEEDKVRIAAQAAGLRLAAHQAEDGWLCLTLSPI